MEFTACYKGELMPEAALTAFTI